MPFEIKLTAVTANGHGITPGDDFSVFLNESTSGSPLPAHLIVAEITNFEAGPAGSTFKFAKAGTTTYDGGGRFELVESGGRWFLAVANPALFDYEDMPIINEISIQRVGPGTNGTLIDEGTFDFYLNDVAETTNLAPTVTNAVFAGSIAHNATTGLPTPFGGVTIADDGATVTVTITLDTASEGASSVIVTVTVAPSSAIVTPPKGNSNKRRYNQRLPYRRY